MGQYYRPFIKSESRLVKDLSFEENWDLTWITKLHLYEESEILQMSKDVASQLNIQVGDFFWLGDYGTVIEIDDEDEVWFSEIPEDSFQWD